MYDENIKKDLQSTLIDTFFKDKEIITGKEILAFSDEKQINLFIIYLLMKEWRSDIQKLKSPYFDYNNQHVKEALKTYMNVVSKHISIKKENFTPLFEKAVNYTFQLVENPESFIITNHLEDELQDIVKYINYHKPYFEGDKDYEIENLTSQVLNNLNLNLHQTDNAPELSSAPNGTQTLPLVSAYEHEEDETPIGLVKIENIKNAISINQRFVFVKEIFNDDAEQFNSVVKQLDDCSSYDEAVSIAQQHITEKTNIEAKDNLFLLIKQKYNFTAK